jgi:hypothetical protein
MKPIKRVTPDEAAAIWCSISNPSARRVARALARAGRRVHYTTIARWRAQNWRPVVHGRHPVEAAREALGVAASALAGDLPIAAEAFARQAQTGERDLSDRELLQRSLRDLLTVQILLGQAVSRNAVVLVGEKTAETAVLMRALATATQAASRALVELSAGADPSSQTPQRRRPADRGRTGWL